MEQVNDIFAGLDQDPWADEQPVAQKPADKAKFATAADALKYVTGGNATVTLKSVKTGTRFTYRVRVKAEEGKRPIMFVSLLVGQNNEADFQYLGHVFVDQMVYWHGRKSRIGEDAPGAKAFAWTWKQLVRGELPSSLEVWHEGSCGRCGRKLTVPESVASGFGPECINHV